MMYHQSFWRTMALTTWNSWPNALQGFRFDEVVHKAVSSGTMQSFLPEVLIKRRCWFSWVEPSCMAYQTFIRYPYSLELVSTVMSYSKLEPATIV